ncbi:MAG: fibronectin-binding autotransporter adhesin [Brevundimonas sp.]|jgi:fibronectin-binding autotransporter adhesin|uniref:autotransporter-associated beta strand repeat-containing protein n=1 Tax=Brevundimonas sp. TaxID=1871086 RepID=UPI0039E5F4D7
MAAIRNSRSARLAASSVLALAAAGVLSAGPTVAQVIDNDTVVVDGTTQTYAAPMYIGSDGVGELQILNGGVVTSPSALIGRRAGSFGDVTIDGEDSRWTIDGNLFVGASGTGSLTIRNGGQLITGGGGVASEVGSFGAVIVTGPGSRWDSFFPIGAGVRGVGTLDISNGGVVTASSLGAGSAAGAQGTVRLSGADSRYVATDRLLMGIYGSGTLTISEGAVAQAQVLTLGQYASGRGTLNIGRAAGGVAVAAGSINTSSIEFGTGGGEIVLNHTESDYELGRTISGAGTIRVLAGRTILSGDNTYTGSTLLEGGTLTLASDSALGASTLRTRTAVVDYADGVNIGNAVALDSNYTNFRVLSGSATHSGVISQGGGRVFNKIGDGELVLTADNTWTGFAWALGGTLTFDGGSLALTEAIIVGGSGPQGAALQARNGAVLSSGFLDVGTSDGDGVVILESGARVSTGTLTMAVGGAAGSLTVRGEASELTIANGMLIGNLGQGELLALDGASLASFSGALGVQAGSLGDATISGADWTNTQNLIVGYRGRGSVVISEGGLVSNLNANLGDLSGGQGFVTVTGAGSLWQSAGDIRVGRQGAGAVTVSGGARLEANEILIADLAGSTGALNIGGAQGEAAAAAGTIGASAIRFGAGGGSIVLNHTDDGYELDETITGAGTIRLLAGRTILSGDNTYTGSTLLEGGTLTLASNTALGGSTLRTTGSVVDYADGVDIANPVVIDSNTTQFQVLTGSATQSGVISEAGGARPFVKVGGGELVLTADSLWSGATTVREGTLTFDGGDLTSSDQLYVEDANLIVRGGGVLTNNNAFVGHAATTGASVTVTGPGSRWINTSQLLLGLDGAGSLTVADGGEVQAVAAYIGGTGSLGTATVTGENSRLLLQDQLYVGSSLGEGVVMIADGGQVLARDIYINATTGAGSATVTGDGSLLYSIDQMVIGNLREGVLTLADGGVARVGDGTGMARLAVSANATGVLNIGAAPGDAPAAAGVLEAAELSFGAGVGTLNFNHTDEGYVFAPRMTGRGTLNHYAGETILSADNSGFSGDYYVQGGRLILEGANGQAADPMTPGSGSILSAEGENAPEIVIRNGGSFTGRVLSADGVGEGSGRIQIAGALSGAEVDEAYAGTMGAGRIELTDGARLTAGDAWLGYFGEGTLSVRDGASAEFGVLSAGLYGQSSIEITGGGRVDAAFVEGAQTWAASTEVTVSGAGSMLNVDNSLVLAREGRGSLSILDGGNVITRQLFMAGGEESVAEVTVSGAGSQLVSIFDLGVGVENGGRGVLTVEDGGVVQAGGLGVGFGAGTTGEVVVRGVESRLAAMEAAIGYGGAGSLLLTEGGALTVMDGSGSVYVGLEAGSTGVLAIGALEGEEAAQAGYLSAEGVVFGAGAGSLIFNHTNTSYIFGTGLSGVGEVRHLAGQTWLVGDNTGFAGLTTVEGGELAVLTNLGGDVLVSGGRLRGSGDILGDVTVTTGVLAGATGGTLTMGSLFLGSSARTDVTLRGAGEFRDPAQPIFDVIGDLTLDGVLNVTEGDDFGVGVYRLFNYGGVLTNNGMTIDMAPTGYTTGDLAIQTALAGQVNLAVSLNDLRFWDGGSENAGNGAIDGGGGVWSLSGYNWTDVDGIQNGANRPVPSLAVFMGSAGVVTVDGSDGDISATGLQFASDGYVLNGDGLLLTDADGEDPVIRVGDGTAAGADISARIDLDLTAFGDLTKTDLGSLILTGDNLLDGLRVRHGGLTLAQGLTQSGELHVGVQTGDEGRLLVTDAARLNSTGAVLGQIAGAEGAGTVSGADSAWTVDGTLFVGAGGEGRLTIENGGLVDAGTAVIASEIGGAGAAMVTGEGSLWTVTSGLFVGGYGDGVLTVENGGRVGALYGAVGTYEGAEGLAVVSGEGSILEFGDYLIIGAADNASGDVILTDGGRLTVGDGAGELVLAESAGARGALTIGALAGSDAAAAGVLQAGQVRFGDGAGELVFNHKEADYGFTATLTGAGAIRHLAGVTRLGGDSSTFNGMSALSGGTLLVDGVLGGDVSVTGGSLGGSGSVLGTATIADGGTLSGVQGRTLNLGELVLSEGATVTAALGAADDSAALFDVVGNLTLDGQLEVSDAGGFGAGVYRLFDYGGVLTDNGLDIASTPVGVDLDDLFLQTSVANQVNLVSTFDVELRFWDGSGPTDNDAIDGGDGIWSLTGREWTGADGAVNGAYDNPAFAVFMGAGGTVTVDGTGIGVTGMQFAADGYELTGDGIELGQPETIIRVGDGTAAGADVTATIASSLTGAGGLVKADLGALILTGVNSYTGGTFVRGGTLVGDADSIRGDLFNDALTIFDQTIDGTFAGAISGTGLLVKRGAGALTLTGSGSYTGGLEVREGTLIGDTRSIVGDVVNDAVLAFDQDFDGTFTGAVSGSGFLIKDGSGVLTLSGANVQDWSVAGGVLTAGTAAFEGDVSIGDGATFRFDLTADRGWSGTLTGGGAFVTGGAELTLTGDSSSYSGQTTLAGGGLQVDGVLGGDVRVSGGELRGTGSILGEVAIGDGSLVGVQGQTLDLGSLVLSAGSNVSVALGAADDASALFDVAGDLTLDGSLEVTDVGGFGAGVYRLFDYGGVLTDNGLDIGAVPTGVSADDLLVQTSVANQVNLVSTFDVELRFWDGPGAADDGAIQGGAGTWSLTGREWTGADGVVNGAYDNPAFAVFMGTGGTVTVDGTGIGVTGMQFAVDGYELIGDAVELTEDETVIRVGDGTAAGADMTATIASALTGSGGLVKTDLGTLILTGTNSYDGGTFVLDGTLIGDADSIAGDVVNDAVLVFDQGADAEFAGAISGDGEAFKRGAGVLSLTGGAAMDWTVETGGLIGQAGAFSGDVAVASGATFSLNADENAAWNGSLSGAGAFTKTGAGGLAMNGNSWDFEGITEIQEGLLVLNGILGGELRIMEGAILAGSGALTQLTAGDGAVIAPGNSIGTLTVTGDVTFEAGSVFEVEVDPTSDSSDRIVVGGAATLNGGVVRHVGYPGAYGPESTYTILTAAGGVTGTFESIETDFAFLDASLDYEANAVLMLLERNEIPFPGVGQTFNQRSTGAAVEATRSGDPLYDAVIGQTADGARFAFDMLSGELHGSIRSAQSEAAQALAGTLRGRMDDARSIETGAAFWAQATGSRTRLATDGNAASVTHGATGLMMGADAGFGAVRLGVAGGASAHDHDSRARAGQAEGDSYSLAAYGSGQWGALGLKGAVSGTWHEVETERLAVFPGFLEVLTADYDAETAHAFVEASWQVDMGPATTLEPFANIARVRTETDAFTEAGGDAALAVQGRVQAANLATIGLGMNRVFDQGDGRTAVLSGRLGWRHAWGDTAGDGRHAFAGSPTPAGAFTVRGLPVAEDAMIAELGLDLDLKDRLSLTVDWSGQYGSGLNANALAAQLNWRF